MAHAAYTLPPAFPQRLSADEKKKKAALKGKMLGGTTSGKPGSRGLGDMAIGRTEGVPQRIVSPVAGGTPSPAAALPLKQPPAH